MNIVTVLILFDAAHQPMAPITAAKIRTHYGLFDWLVEISGVGQRLAGYGIYRNFGLNEARGS